MLENQDSTLKWRDTIPKIPCLFCGKPDTTGYCSEKCERLDLSKVCTVTLREVLEGKQ